MTQLPNHYGVTPPKCPCCKTRITVHQKINPGHCGAMNCALKFAHDTAIQREAKERKVIKKTRKIAEFIVKKSIQNIARTLGVTPGAVKTGIVPYQNNPVTALPDDARAAFIAHLETTVATAYDSARHTSAIGPVAPPPLHIPTPIELAGCTACQGHCCQQGRGRHAFLAQSVFENLFHLHPHLGMEEVIAFYVAALPDQSVKDACVFQSRTGCTLPRDWRSDVCNTYRCRDLIRLSDKFPPGRDKAVAVVAVDGDQTQILAHRSTVGTFAVTED